MAKKKPVSGVETIEQTLSKTEQYIENNQKMLTIIIVGILIIIGGYLAYMKLYLKPLDTEAISQMFAAEQYFEKDSFQLAIDGDGNMPGFIDIIDEYGSTKAGNLSNYYAGICYLRLGQYDDAIEYLESFSSNDMMLSAVSIGAIGDAYMEKGETQTAVEKYLNAAKTNPNEFSTPIFLMKAGRAYEILGDYKNALVQYQAIEKDYDESNEGRTIEKYIIQAELKAK